MCSRRPSDNSFVNLITGNVSGQSSYGRYSVSTANAPSSFRPAAQDHGNSSSRADHSYGSGWRAEARAKFQSSRVFSHPYAKPVVKSNGYVYGSPKGSAGYGSHRAPYFNRGNQSASSNNPTFYNRLSWNNTFSNNQATSFGHENGMRDQRQAYRGGAPATQSFHNRSMTGMEFVHGRGNVQSMNFTVFHNMNSNNSAHQAASSGHSNVHQPVNSCNGDNEYGRGPIRLTVSQLFGRPEVPEVSINPIRPPQDDSEGLTNGFEIPVDQQSSGQSITSPPDRSHTPLGALAEAVEDGGDEAHIKTGTPLMRLSAFETQIGKRTSTTSSPEGNFIQSCGSSSVKAGNDVNTDCGDSAIAKTSQPTKEVITDAPTVSVQEGKPKRKRTRSPKSSRNNKTFNKDQAIGNQKDDYQYLNEPAADEPTGGFAVPHCIPNNKNIPPGFSAAPSKHTGMESSVKKGIHSMVIPEFKGQRASKKSPACLSNHRSSVSLAQKEPVAHEKCVGEDELGESTFQPQKEVLTDAPTVSVQEGKPKRKGTRSRKSSRNNKSFNKDQAIGNHKDGFQYLDKPVADEPTSGITVSHRMQNNKNTPPGFSAGPLKHAGMESSVKKGIHSMVIPEFKGQRASKKSPACLSNHRSSVSLAQKEPVAHEKCVGEDELGESTFQPQKEVLTDAPTVSVQEGKPKRKRTRSRKSSRNNKTFNKDQAIGNQKDDYQYLNEPAADEPTGGFAVPHCIPNNKNIPPGFSAAPSKHAGMESSVKKGIHSMVIPEFKGRGASKKSPACLSNHKSSVSLAQKEPVADDKCVGEDELEGGTFQPQKEVPNDVPNTSGQGVKPKRKRNRSKKSSKANQSFSADKTVGSYKYDSQYLDDSIADEPTEGFTVFQNMDSQFKRLTISRKSTSPILNLTMDVAPTEFDVTLPESNLNQTFSGILKVGKKNTRPKSVVFGKFPTPLARSETFAELHPPRHPLARAGWKNSAKLINLETIEVELYDEYVGIYKAHSCTNKMRQMPEIVVDKDTVYYCIEGTDELLELPPNFEFNLYPVEELPSGFIMAGRYKFMFDDENDKLGKFLKTVCTASMKNQWTQSNLPELMLKHRVTRIAPEKVLPTDDDSLVPDEELSVYHRCMRKGFLKRFKMLPESPPADLPEDVDHWTPPDLSRAGLLARKEWDAYIKINGFWRMKDDFSEEKNSVEDQKDASDRAKRPIMLPKQVKVGRAEYALPGSRVGPLHTFSPECAANDAPSSEPTCSSMPSVEGMSTPTKLVSPSMFNPLASSTPRKDSDSEGKEPIVRRLRDPMDDIPSTSGSAGQCSSRMMETPKVHKPRDRKPKGHWANKAGLEKPPSSD